MRTIFRETFRTVTNNWIVFYRKSTKLLAKSVLILIPTAAASATDARIQKKLCGFLIKDVSETIKNEAK